MAHASCHYRAIQDISNNMLVSQKTLNIHDCRLRCFSVCHVRGRGRDVDLVDGVRLPSVLEYHGAVPQVVRCVHFELELLFEGGRRERGGDGRYITTTQDFHQQAMKDDNILRGSNNLHRTGHHIHNHTALTLLTSAHI